MHLAWIALPIMTGVVLLWLLARTRSSATKLRPEQCERDDEETRLAFEAAKLARTRPNALPHSHERAERWHDQRPFRC
jgi:hypothetical protein